MDTLVWLRITRTDESSGFQVEGEKMLADVCLSIEYSTPPLFPLASGPQFLFEPPYFSFSLPLIEARFCTGRGSEGRIETHFLGLLPPKSGSHAPCIFHPFLSHMVHSSLFNSTSLVCHLSLRLGPKEQGCLPTCWTRISTHCFYSFLFFNAHYLCLEINFLLLSTIFYNL